MSIRIAPSILSADFRYLADQVRQAEEAGADYIHVDVMDGAFVPNITMGPVIVSAVRASTSLPVDVHLMIEEPQRYLSDFARAGASIITVHAEAARHLQAALAAIRDMGLKAGVALNPATPLSMVEEACADLDLLLVMTVNPGFGGQRMIPWTVDKVARARAMLDRLNPAAELEVDGGLSPQNAGPLVKAGAQVLVAGSSIFGARDGIAAGIKALRMSATG